MSTTKLVSAVEGYLTDLRKIRASGGGMGERSYYPSLTNLLNPVGSTLKPKISVPVRWTSKVRDTQTSVCMQRSRSRRASRARVKPLSVRCCRSNLPTMMPG